MQARVGSPYLASPMSPASLDLKLALMQQMGEMESPAKGKGAGDAKAEVLALALKDLQEKYHAKEKELKGLKELKAAKAAKLQESGGSALAGDTGLADSREDEPCEQEGLPAARQSLRRLCTARANGSLLVPQDTYTKFWNGGSDRKKLLTLFVAHGCDRDRFIKEVKVLSEKEKKMQLEVGGDYFSEEDLRDLKKLSEYPVGIYTTYMHATFSEIGVCECMGSMGRVFDPAIIMSL